MINIMPPSNAGRTVEAKYTFPVGLAQPIRTGLETLCVPDSEHPDNLISSVYFDTHNRLHLSEKLDSDYLKSKVRLRWYGDPTGISDSEITQGYLEVKFKQGIFRRKNRVPVSLPTEALLSGQESYETFAGFSHLARQCEYRYSGPIHPMIIVRYRRHRFFDPLTLARLSIDTGISYSSVNEQFFPRAPSRTLGIGVLEIKSKTGEMPASFSAIRNFINRRDSFSKYEECWQIYNDPHYRREFQWMQFRKL